MNQILKEVLSIKDCDNIYNSFARKNNLNSINFKLITQENFENFQNFIEAIVQKGPRKSKKRWVSNERRILHILLNCCSVIYRKAVEQFKTEQIQRINRVFPYKDKYSIEYQLRKLSTNSKQNRRRWSQRQENFLQDIVKKTQNKNKWNEIARQLFIHSKGEYFRQGKHCRERFFKLKQDKGQESLSERVLSQDSSENENQCQFHSHSSVRSESEVDISPRIIQNKKKLNIKKFNVKKQLDYNQKSFKSSSHSNSQKIDCQKSEKPIHCQKITHKGTRQTIQEEKEQPNHCLRQCQNHQKFTDQFQSQNKHSITPKVVQDSKNQIQNQNIQPSIPVGQQNMFNGVIYNPFMINLSSNEAQTQNGMIGQVWITPAHLWTMSGFPFNFQGFF